MIQNDIKETVIKLQHLSHRYGRIKALNDVSISIRRGCTVGLIGPDGVGKSTLLSLICGVKKLQQGSIEVLGSKVRTQKDRDYLSSKIAYMPQGLGLNLYFSLSVYENIEFIARLSQIPVVVREKKIEQLLKSTGLYPYKDRPAGQLSGGMKQKLSLCCALVYDPEILILDEPTTGVDPLSRRQFWLLIDKLRELRPEMTMIVATAYMEEAEQFEHLLGLFNGQLIFNEKLEKLLSTSKSQSVEEAFVKHLPKSYQADRHLVMTPFVKKEGEEAVIQAHNLVKRFGHFTAVDGVSFSIERGEIFGFLGSNGCGKTTTMKMLTGLLTADSGSAVLLGQPVEKTNDATKMKIGYMSQLFSLYEELTIKENLQLHAKLYRLPTDKQADMVKEALTRFDLLHFADIKPSDVSLGIQQRLQLAAACLHQPEVLILDEPTSGVDPVARDMFWQYLMNLSRQDRITIFVSTHFMNEAQRCDRISFMDEGKVLAMGSADDLKEKAGTNNLEDAFIHYLLQAHGQKSVMETVHIDGIQELIEKTNHTRKRGLLGNVIGWFDMVAVFAYREIKELTRDKVRIAFTFLGPLILLMTAVACISFDIENIRFAVVDDDHTSLSADLIQAFGGSRYFSQVSQIPTFSKAYDELKKHDVDLLIHIPKNYGKDLNRRLQPSVDFMIDGAQSFKASTIKEYVSGIMLQYNIHYLKNNQVVEHPFSLPNFIEQRFMYNPEFKTVYAIVPGMIMLSLILMTIMLTALGIVREKEKGSIINFYCSSAKPLQYLLGKQLPYVVLTFFSALFLISFSVLFFAVPYQGSLIALLVGVIFYLLAISALGLLLSVFANTQIVVLFLASIVALIPTANFSGLIYPVSTLTGIGYWIGILFPASWFQRISLGVFNKGLGINDLWLPYLMLLAFAIVYILLASMLLKKQET